MNSLPENAKEIPGMAGFAVSTIGEIFTRKAKGTGKLTDSWRSRGYGHSAGNGYLGFWLGNGRREYVHRAVMLAFVGPCPGGHEVCHCDGDRRNNKLSNLRYDTHENNCRDTIKHDRSTHGERNIKAKLSADAVVLIRERLASGLLSQREIAGEFGVDQSMICKINKNKNWRRPEYHSTPVVMP